VRSGETSTEREIWLLREYLPKFSSHQRGVMPGSGILNVLLRKSLATSNTPKEPRENSSRPEPVLIESLGGEERLERAC